MIGVIEPPLPADTNLRDFDWMPLEVRRLLKSDWWILACLEEPQAALAAVRVVAAARPGTRTRRVTSHATDRSNSS